MSSLTVRPRLHGTGSLGHDINFNSFNTPVNFQLQIILQNLIKTSHREGGRSKYDRKQTELDVVTTRIRYHVNGV